MGLRDDEISSLQGVHSKLLGSAGSQGKGRGLQLGCAHLAGCSGPWVVVMAAGLAERCGRFGLPLHSKLVFWAC